MRSMGIRRSSSRFGHRAAGRLGLAKRSPAMGENTTIACVATDAALTPAQARRLAIMAQMASPASSRPRALRRRRRLRPLHRPARAFGWHFMLTAWGAGGR